MLNVNYVWLNKQFKIKEKEISSQILKSKQKHIFLETLFSRYYAVIEEETCRLNPFNRDVNHGVSLYKLM